MLGKKCFRGFLNCGAAGFKLIFSQPGEFDVRGCDGEIESLVEINQSCWWGNEGEDMTLTIHQIQGNSL